MKNLIFALAFLLLTVPCFAEIIIVDNEWPYDFNNIQAAIDYSSNGDYIIVFPGTYAGEGNRDIDFLGKSVTVQSIDPTDPYIVTETIIDCNGVDIYDRHYGFLFQSGEDANSILAGFTITNCGSGAIQCGNSSPTIKNCIITGNSSYDGVIHCYGSGTPAISNCTISGNTSSGIYCEFGNGPTITNCIITGNTGWGRPPP
jgi:parallel beta-helix repeat protein